MDKVMLFFLTTCGMALVAAGFGAAWLSAMARARRAERLVDRLLLGRPELLPQSDDRIAFLEAELARLGEEHQFFGRLVSRQLEQRPDSPGPSIPTGATPH